MGKHECAECGYIYDEETGDNVINVAPGTTLEDLPDDWICPICGAGKSYFVRV
ncbi:MAG: rubredoxin [Proteobacteria bacterium]|nr:rubredoxin [Pseudomonadota bacterium]